MRENELLAVSVIVSGVWKTELLCKHKYLNFLAPVIAANVTSNHIRCNSVVKYRAASMFEQGELFITSRGKKHFYHPLIHL